MKYPIKSARGVYYNLDYSPYEFHNSYGEIFKFSSAKKLEIYRREHGKRIEKLINNVNSLNEITGLQFNIKPDVIKALEVMLYRDIEK